MGIMNTIKNLFKKKGVPGGEITPSLVIHGAMATQTLRDVVADLEVENGSSNNLEADIITAGDIHITGIVIDKSKCPIKIRAKAIKEEANRYGRIINRTKSWRIKKKNYKKYDEACGKFFSEIILKGCNKECEK